MIEHLEQRENMALPDAVAALSSLPGAPHSLLIDIDGDIAREWSTTKIVTTPPYAGTVDDMMELFAIVSEDYSPFAINVTFNEALAGVRPMRVVVGGDGSWWFGALGVAKYREYQSTATQPAAFVFAEHAGNHPRAVADAVSHEAGHAFGLLHTIDANGNPATGDARLSPIMGFNTGSDRATWSTGIDDNGLYQDDVQVLGSVLGFRPDDAPDLWATPIVVSGHVSGIVNSVMDRDQYSFYASGPTRITLELPPHNNLSAGLELRTTGASLLKRLDAVVDSTTIERTLAPGWYRLTIGTSPREAGNLGRYGITIESGEAVATLLEKKR